MMRMLSGSQASCLFFIVARLTLNPQIFHPLLLPLTPIVPPFLDGTLNACYNCIDRHIENGNGDKTAIIFEGGEGERGATAGAKRQQHNAQYYN